jgi:hypothetical protein
MKGRSFDIVEFGARWRQPASSSLTRMAGVLACVYESVREQGIQDLIARRPWAEGVECASPHCPAAPALGGRWMRAGRRQRGKGRAITAPVLKVPLGLPAPSFVPSMGNAAARVRSHARQRANSQCLRPHSGRHFHFRGRQPSDLPATTTRCCRQGHSCLHSEMTCVRALGFGAVSPHRDQIKESAGAGRRVPRPGRRPRNDHEPSQPPKPRSAHPADGVHGKLLHDPSIGAVNRWNLVRRSTLITSWQSHSLLDACPRGGFD